jgi:hypothetical protein
MDASRSTHFNRGQRLTPEHLNSLRDFSLARDALLSRAFFGTSGIVQGFRDECSVCVHADGVVTVAPGLAVNRNGDVLHLERTAAIDLRRVALPGKYFLQLRSEEILEDPYEDPEYSEIKGYRYRRLCVSLQIAPLVDPDAVEVARVLLANGHGYRLVCDDDDVDPEAGVVDQRHALKICIYSHHKTPFADQCTLKSSIESFRSVMTSIEALYPDAKHTAAVVRGCVRLQAEVQEPVLPVYKTQFLLREVRASLLLSLEELRYLYGQRADAAAQHWSDLLAMVDRLDMKNPDGCLEAFRILASISVILKEKFLDLSAINEQRLLVLDSIKSLRDIEFGHHPLHAFAGLIFDQKIALDANRLNEHATVTSEFCTMMTFRSQLAHESPQSYKALFTAKGRIDIRLDSLCANVDTILIWRLYQRRGTCRYQVALNGKEIFSDSDRSTEHKNSLVNIGTSVRGQMIAAADNVLSIEIPQADMDFGIVGLWVYQLKEGDRL